MAADFRVSVVANVGSAGAGSDPKASTNVLGRGIALFAASIGSGFRPTFGSGWHVVWESPFEQLERRVGDGASALLAFYSRRRTPGAGLVSRAQLRVGWLRYAEQQ